MINKKFYLKIIILFLFLTKNHIFANEINIKYVVADNVITNIDIKNEINYLLLINNRLSELENELLVEYAAKSLIREKIKEIELKKNFIFGENDKLVKDQILKFRNNLNMDNDEDFNNLLLNLNLNQKLIAKKIEIEILWNKLIYDKFINQIYVDKKQIEEELRFKIDNSEEKIKEYLLYEILFSGNTTEELETTFNKIKKSISDIGFENTASILSISDSSKFAGKIGWINQNQISKQIYNKIKNLKNSEVSEPLNVPNGILILMLKDQREIAKEISFDDELQAMINKEAERQLTQLSQTFFKKIELNTDIYEK